MFVHNGLPYHLFPFVSICFVSFCFVSIGFVPFRLVSFRFDLFRFVPFRFCFVSHFTGTLQSIGQYQSTLCSSSTKSQPNINYLQYKNTKRKYRNIALTIAANVY